MFLLFLFLHRQIHPLTGIMSRYEMYTPVLNDESPCSHVCEWNKVQILETKKYCFGNFSQLY